MSRMKKTRHYHYEDLVAVALSRVNAEQRAVMEKMLQTGWHVVKALSNEGRCAVNLAWKDTSGWLTPDAKFHRPIAGKKHVYVNTVTLERVWR